MRIFGSKPGTYGAGLLQLIDSRSWRDDADLAEVYSTWGGYAYGRGIDGVPARGDMETAYRRIAVAAKNTDTREHDIADSDDYYQYHGGMVATVRALTGSAPAAYVGDSTRPGVGRAPAPCTEETSRVFRARVVNPRWIAGHAPARLQGRVRDGGDGRLPLRLGRYDGRGRRLACTRSSPRSTCSTRSTGSSSPTSNPWALHGIAERLLEAVDRGLWEAPEDATLDALRQAYLETEGELEGE